MKLFSKLVIVVLVLSVMVAFAGCGTVQDTVPAGDSTASGEAAPAEGSAEQSASSGDSGKISVALLLPGSLNDGGWNANAYAGLMELKDEGYEVAFTESVEISAIEEAFTNYASKGFDLIVGHGFEFGEPAMRVAPGFPEVNFFVSGKMPDGVTVESIPDNMAFMDMKEYEAAYLAGMVAGGVTKSNIIGYVAGLEIPSQLSDMGAFVMGVEAVNKDAKVYGVVTGTFEDPAKGQEAANAQIDMGADIICQSADSTGMGAMEAAKAKNVYIIGYGGDQNELFPDLVLTSFITNNKSVIVTQAKKIESGTFGGLWSPGVADGTCYIAPYHDLENVIPKEIRDQVEKAKEQIKSGELVIPEITERIDEKLS